MLADSHNKNRGMLQIARPLSGSDDNGPSAVCHQAGVEETKRFHDPSGTVVILKSHLLPVHRGHRIQIGPFSLPHGDLFPCLWACAEGVHRPPCGQGVACGSSKVTEDGVIRAPLHEHATHAVTGKRIMSIGQNDILAKT